MLHGFRWSAAIAFGVAVLVCGGCTPGEPRVNATVRLGIPADFSMPVGQDVDVGGDYIVEYEAESSTAVLCIRPVNRVHC